MSYSYYIYQHRESDSGRIFYVGKGRHRRAWKSEKRNSAWTNVAKIHGFAPEILFRTDDQELAFFAEQETIDLYRSRGIGLTNLSNGGEGCPGYQHRQAHIDKLKGNRFGASSWGRTFKGKTHSDEAKRIMSEKRKGIDNGKWKGKKRSAESRLKMSIAKKGKPNIWARKLTHEQIKEIHETLDYRQIATFARRYKVGESTIRRIRDGEYYKDAQ